MYIYLSAGDKVFSDLLFKERLPVGAKISEIICLQTAAKAQRALAAAFDKIKNRPWSRVN